MSRSIHFFAAEGDLAPVFDAVESTSALQYVWASMCDTSDVLRLRTYQEIPRIGIASSGDSNSEPFWLVADTAVTISVEAIPQKQGGTRYVADQWMNPQTVVLTLGGVFKDIAVIPGEVSTCTTDPDSRRLLERFRKEIPKRFVRIQSYWVGPQAEKFLNDGYRLTTALTDPPFTDLKRT